MQSLGFLADRAYQRWHFQGSLMASRREATNHETKNQKT